MPLRSLFDRLVALPPPQGVAKHVPPEIIAFNVSVSRKLRAWKQSALADLAGISLSTVERIERGEKVQPEALEKVGATFGFEPGYYTAPRKPLTPEQMAAPEHNPYPHVAPVQVSPLDSRAKLRRLAACDVLVHAPLDGPADRPDLVSGLFELLEFLAFRLAAPSILPKSALGGLRVLYRAIFDHLDVMRRAGYGVICGVETETDRDPARRVGVIGIAKRANDPGVLARKILILDRRHFVATGEQR